MPLEPVLSCSLDDLVEEPVAEDVAPRQAGAVSRPDAKSGRLWIKLCHGYNGTMELLERSFIEMVVAEVVARGIEEPDENDLVALAKELAPGYASTTAPTLLALIKKDARLGLRRNRRRRQRFEARLAKHWATPLHLLELLVELAQEIGETIAEDSRAVDGPSDEHTLSALIAIHARGCQVTRAILSLLRSGFADDAHARWRSLHDLAVVSAFISKHRGDVAERYLLHEIVQQRKLAQQYKNYETRARLEPLSQAEMDELDERYGSLIDRFGKSFGTDNGWAASVLGKERPDFADIECDVGLDHWRPYVRMSSDNVHAGVHGALYRLGIGGTGRGVLLAGPSNLGLADPGHGAALSLSLITAALVEVCPTVGHRIHSMVLNLLQEETGEAFLKAHKHAENLQNVRFGIQFAAADF